MTGQSPNDPDPGSSLGVDHANRRSLHRSGHDSHAEAELGIR